MINWINFIDSFGAVVLNRGAAAHMVPLKTVRGAAVITLIDLFHLFYHPRVQPNRDIVDRGLRNTDSE